jgi:hypothetical protein
MKISTFPIALLIFSTSILGTNLKGNATQPESSSTNPMGTTVSPIGGGTPDAPSITPPEKKPSLTPAPYPAGAPPTSAPTTSAPIPTTPIPLPSNVAPDAPSSSPTTPNTPAGTPTSLPSKSSTP